jgi:hypothetical protein
MAGLFFVMGLEALVGNGMTLKLLFLAKDKGLTAVSHPLRKIDIKAVWWFVVIELIGFGSVGSPFRSFTWRIMSLMQGTCHVNTGSRLTGVINRLLLLRRPSLLSGMYSTLSDGKIQWLILRCFRFPVFIFALIPIRVLLMPKWFKPEELGALDAATASPFTLESCGGTWGTYENSTVVSSAHTLNPNDDIMERGAMSSGQEKDAIEEAGSSWKRGSN